MQLVNLEVKRMRPFSTVVLALFALTMAATSALSFDGRGSWGGPFEGTWWRRPSLARELGLTQEQVTRMDEIFKESRFRLIDLRTALQKEEILLGDLVEQEGASQEAVMAQIDRIQAARTGLMKARVGMLLKVRQVLTKEQAEKIKERRGEFRHGMRRTFRPPFERPAGPAPQPGGPAPS